MLRLGSFCEDAGCYCFTSNKTENLEARYHKACGLQEIVILSSNSFVESKWLREACSFSLLLETHLEKPLHYGVC